MLQEFMSDSARWIYTTLVTLGLAFLGWAKKRRDDAITEKKELVNKVTDLESDVRSLKEGLDAVDDKLTEEVGARKEMYSEIKEMHKVLTQVQINTAVNKAKLG